MDFITNHTKIIVTDRQTGETVTLLDTEESIIASVVAGLPVVDVIDDSLDSFTFVLKNYPSRKPFKSFDLVEFSVEDGMDEETIKMFVLFDKVNSYVKLPGEKTYEHTVSCVELTKILEKIKIYNLNLTSLKDKNLFEQVEKILVNAIPNYSAQYYGEVKFNLVAATSLEDFLSDKPTRDFYFENTDLRSALDEVLSMHNARIIVTDVSISQKGEGITGLSLDYISMDVVQDIEPTWTEEEQGAIIHEELENNGQDFAGKIQARGYNTNLEQYPITIEDYLKSENAVLSNKNATLILPFPISDRGIVKLSVLVGMRWKIEEGETVKTVDTTEEIDLTTLFLPQEQYDLYSQEQAKKYTPYQFGSTTVRMGDSYSNWFGWEKTKIEEAVKTGISNRIIDIYHEKGVDNFDSIIDTKNIYGFGKNASIDQGSAAAAWFKLFKFKCTYYPTINTIAEITKPSIQAAGDRFFGVMDSQQEKTIDVHRHGKKLSGLIKRTGNTEYTVDVKAIYYSKLLPLMSRITLPDAADGDKEEQNYVLYKREYAIYDNFINCRYYFSQNYHSVQENAGVNRERHLYAIPLAESETPIVLHQYMVFSTGDNIPMNTDCIFFNFLNAAIGTIPESHVQKEQVDESIKYLYFQSTDKGNDTYPQNTDGVNNSDKPYSSDEALRFVLPVASYAQDKCIHFVSKPLDNYSVTYSDIGYNLSLWGDGGYRMSYNRYVSRSDDPGACKKFKLSWGKNPPNTEDKYPSHIGKIRTPWMQEVEYNYFLDRTQTPMFDLCFECIPSRKELGDIIIGSAFCKNNSLIRSRTKTLDRIYLYIFNDYKFKGDEEYLSEDLYKAYSPRSERCRRELAFEQKGIFNEMGAWYRAVMFKYNDYTFPISEGFKFTSKDVKSFAFADGDTGEIYLAVNGPLRNIYMTIVDYEK